MSRRRWDIGFVVALFTIGFGLLLADPVLVTAAVVGLAYVLYGSFSRLPDGVELSATREFDTTGTGPGQPVDVTLHVENTGEAVLPDLRVVDGVPEELGVVEGSPRDAFALGPGERATVEYTVVLQRGRFEFERPVTRLRSLAGTDRRSLELSVAGDSSLLCSETATRPQLADSTLRNAGTVPTDSGGSGLEFYSTRQYHPGDPMNRINWHQLAKTGEFVTVQYRRERAARTVIVVDCRPCTRVTPWAGYPTVGSLSAYAAERVYDALQKAGVVTTLTAVGVDEELSHLTGPDGLPWIDPGSKDGSSTALFRGAHRVARGAPEALSLRPPAPGIDRGERTAVRARADGGEGGSEQTGRDRTKAGRERDRGAASAEERREAASATGNRAGTGQHEHWTRTERTERLLSRLPADAQVVLCSPLLDNWPVEFARELELHGYPCTLISPDATSGTGYGQRIGAVHRRLRLRTLERTGVTVTDWPIDRPVEYALQYTLPQL